MADSSSPQEVLTLTEAFNVYFLQVPTYHLVVEILLVVYILRLLLSKNHDKPKDEKLTKQVYVMLSLLPAVAMVTGRG